MEADQALHSRKDILEIHDDPAMNVVHVDVTVCVDVHIGSPALYKHLCGQNQENGPGAFRGGRARKGRVPTSKSGRQGLSAEGVSAGHQHLWPFPAC